jgi:hypothetical protein
MKRRRIAARPLEHPIVIEIRGGGRRSDGNALQTMMRIVLLLAAALLLAGCAGLRAPGTDDGGLERRQTIELLDYAQRVAAMPAEQQRHEYGASNRAYAKNKDRVSRLRLALLLVLPGTSFHDSARAAGLLEPEAAQDKASGPLRSLASLVYAPLNELAGEHKRANQMREQLEALKALERTILERAQESAPRRR